MKNLKDSILEKLSVDNIIPDNYFPIDKSINDMVNFLIENGYKEIPYERFWDDTIDKFSKTTGKCFMASNINLEMFFLSFMDRSNSKFKNILFNITEESNKCNYTILDIETAVGGGDAKHINKKQFLKKVNNLF